MMDKKLIIALVILVLVVVAGAFLVATPSPSNDGNNSPIGSYETDNVKVFEPLPGSTVSRTFTIKGEARGTWYFEASFPINVLDKDGNVLWAAPAQAEGDWMTTEFVPFSALITIENYSGPATLVLKKDNPSGLPEHEDSVSFAIIIEQ